eukprot:TRINITY_DN34794_c0_g1_i3.p1 TRINITY_DN34794_c0_g1~~TRINITY_DN34794_c0_g1_i3.p1  ORF type:complete len:244 (+),score=62.15 TRINITY_DN34794_c0_g1_i3:81-734(+)
MREEMQGFKGGLNEGIWFVSDPDRVPSGPSSPRAASAREDLVFKLVKCQRTTPSILTEAENFMEISKKFLEIMNDPVLAFPHKIFACWFNGAKRHDLIVMRKVRGERLAELIAHKMFQNKGAQIYRILERLGACLAHFHGRYGGAQHGDFQPSNIYYDEESDEVALIDVGGMGVPTLETDVEHFSISLQLLSESYGPHFTTEGIRRFKAGYDAALHR